MHLWQKLRIIFLAITLSGVVLVFIRVLQTKTINKPKSEETRRFENNICIVSPKMRNYDVVS